METSKEILRKDFAIKIFNDVIGNTMIFNSEKPTKYLLESLVATKKPNNFKTTLKEYAHLILQSKQFLSKLFRH